MEVKSPMRGFSPPNAWLAIVALLAFAAPIAILASPGAATVSILVTLVGLAAGLLIQVLFLNRRYAGRWRPATRRPYLVPADLPPPPGLLVGRDDELDVICRLLGAGRDSGHDVANAERAAVVLITGGEGVGKTALAVTAAHILSSQYPDGQILVRFDTQRTDGTEHARTYLTRALRSPQEGELASDEFDKWYRRRTARQRILIVLDNVADDVDIDRLLPSGRRCAVIVTSRQPLADRRTNLSRALNPLDAKPSADLLRALTGEQDADLEPHHVDWIVAAAGGYPAALQMAGAVVRARRSWDLDVAFRTAETVKLTATAEGAPRFVRLLNLACALLTEQERSCLALLALPDSRHVPRWALAALARGAFPSWTDFGEVEAGRVMDRLARFRFAELRVDDRSGVVVYRLPGYVKVYARMLLSSEIDAAGIYQARAAFAQADRLRLERRPELLQRLNVYHLLDDGHLDEALDAARETLHLAQERLRGNGHHDGVEADSVRGDEALAKVALAEVFAELGWIDDALTYALVTPTTIEPLTKVRAMRVQGRIRWRLRQSTAALALLNAAKDDRALSNDPAERIRVLRELTVAYAMSPDPTPALEIGRSALALCSAQPAAQARRRPGVLWAYGFALTANKAFDEADEVLRDADRLSGQEDLQQGLWRPWIRHQRAYLALRAGEYDTARTLAASALDRFTTIIHRYGSGHCRLLIGRSYLAESQYDLAVPALEEALQTFARCGDRWIEAETAYWLGRAYAASPLRAENAEAMLTAALTTFETLKDQRHVARAQAALRERDRETIRRLTRWGERHLPDAPKVTT